MVDCQDCAGNGVVIVGKFQDQHMVEICTTCDGEGEVFWLGITPIDAQEVCLPENCCPGDISAGK